MDALKLSTYPYVIVRMACIACRRASSYRLARLAARFGPETPIDEVLTALAGDCPGKGIKRHKGSYPVCGISLADLAKPAPPDLPPGVPNQAGGKTPAARPAR